MLTWDSAQTTCQDFTSDDSTSSLTFFKRHMNLYYKRILADLGLSVTERTQTATTVASQQYYQMPPDTLFVKSLTISVGGIAYPTQEVPDQETWNLLNARSSQTSDIPQFHFIRPGFGLSGTEVGIYPIPSSSSNTMTVIYEANDRDLSQDAYTTGTVTVTNGSATVTGSGTTFTAAMVGRYFQTTNDGVWYRIASFTSTTSIALENVFEGTTAAGAAYTIAEAFHVPEEMQILPVYGAMVAYYRMKKNQPLVESYTIDFEEGMEAAKKRWGSKSRNPVTRKKLPISKFPMANPPYFPTSVS